MNTIAGRWAIFEKLVMPQDAPPVQRQEMRRAFYSGAQAMLHLQLLAIEPGLSEHASVAMLEGWHDECRRFAQQVAQGQA